MRARVCRWCDVRFVTPLLLRFLVSAGQECETQAARLELDRIIADFLYGGDARPAGTPGEDP